MSTAPAFPHERGFGPKKGKAKLVEHFGANGKKRAAKIPFFEGTGSTEKLCYAFSSFLQAMKAVKAAEGELQGHFAAALGSQAARATLQLSSHLLQEELGEDIRIVMSRPLETQEVYSQL